MSQQLAGKVAIITGASSVIAGAAARMLVREGAQLILTDLDYDAVRNMANELGAENAIAITHDVTSESSWQSLIETTLNTFGKLNILINHTNAIVTGTVMETSFEQWQRVQAINGDGMFLACRNCMPVMEAGGGGSIINVVAHTLMVDNTPAYCAYAASNGAVRALAHNIANYCGERNRGVRCNTVLPSGIAEPAVDKGSVFALNHLLDKSKSRFCGPEDVANMILLLASDHSQHMNGTEFSIDTGRQIGLTT